jgi:hypothetical protein
MAVTIATVQKMYKDVFKGDNPAMLAMRGKPGLKRIKKADDMEGYKSIYPVRVHLHTGASHTFTDAQDNDTANDIYRFELQAKNSYAVVNFDAKAMAFARSSVGSYLRLKAKEIQETLEYAGQRMEKELWRGTPVGSVTAAPVLVSGSTYTVTLADATDIINIHKGQVIECWDTATAASATQRAEECVVTVVNHSAGTFQGTFTGNPTAWGTNTDYLFIEGDRTASAILGWTGISDYIPSTDPVALESFQGLDRSVMPNYLAGWRGTTYATIEESGQQLCTKMAPFVEAIDGKAEYWCHPQVFQSLQSEAGARLVREQGGTPILGYTRAKIATALGDIPVMTGPSVPKTDLFLLDWSTWSLHTNKPLFHLVNEDGQEMLRKAAADEFEMRWRGWSEPLCDEPVKNGRVAVTL